MSVINIDSGDIFATEADAIVNPVNCVGTMGKGLALEFKKRFPENDAAYRKFCARQLLAPGGLFVFDQESIPGIGRVEGPGKQRFILNLATKDHWRDPSRLEWITDGAAALAKLAKNLHIKSIACPALGAGLGGLEWPLVKREIEAAFRETDVKLFLFAPQGPANGPKKSGFSPR